MDRLRRHNLTRREAMKTGLKVGAYAAPVILSVSVPVAGVGAATPAPGTMTFGHDAVFTAAGAGATFDVYYTLSSQAAGALTLLGTVTADRFGFGGGVFPLTVDPATVTSVRLTYILHGNPSTSPPATTFTSNVAGLLSRATATFAGIVVQEPTVAACQVGPLNQFTEYIDVAIIKGPANTAYDFYVQPNTLGTPVKVTTATTNANGNVTVFAPTPAPLTTATPTSVVVTAVLAGGSPATPAFTLTASGGTLTTIACASLQGVGSARAIGIG
jgi:hypothetical protein